MTPAELLQFTYVRFKLSVLSLMLMISVFLFYNVFHHTVSLVALVYALVYILVLNIGMRGASSRSLKMLRFYWIFQFIQLIVFLLTAAALAGFFTYVHVLSYEQMRHDQAANKNIAALNSQTLTVGNEKVDIHHDVSIHSTNAAQNSVTQSNVDLPKPAPSCSFATLLPMILPSVIALVVIFSITRSIVLARQLIAVIETHGELADVELCNSCCNEEECKSTPAAVEEPVPAPENVYVMPQAYLVPEHVVYPGQLMPVYVDKFGQATH
jgi:hemin uptake protein HemP